MWYKRYGYKAPASSTGGAIGCLSVSVIGMSAIILSITLTVYFENGWLLLIAIPLSITGFEIVNRYSQGAGIRIKSKRYNDYIKETKRYIQAGNIEAALDSIRKIKIYGEVPEELKEFEKENTTKNA